MQHRRLIAAALALSLVSAYAADTPSTQVPRRTVADRLADARKAIEAREWNVALRELNAAAREEPNNADVHNLLGYSWRKRSNPDVTKAFEHYYTALRIDPRHKGAH